jgi:uncharacterized RDD family membrane protein YckC
MNTTNPYAPPQAAVQDVAEPGQHALAGRGTRLGAAIVDGLILVVMVYVPLVISIRMSGHPLLVNAHFNYAALINSAILLPIVGLIAFAWLNVLFVSRNGQSIAKKLMGIKVVRSDGSKASLGRIFWLRNVVNIVIGIIPLLGSLYGLVDSLLIFGEPRQCAHDKIADTIVIDA